MKKKKKKKKERTGIEHLYTEIRLRPEADPVLVRRLALADEPRD